MNEKPENMELDSKLTTMNVENLASDDEYVEFTCDEKAGMEGNLNNISSNMKRNLSIDECKVEARSEEKALASVSKSVVQSSVSPEVCHSR